MLPILFDTIEMPNFYNDEINNFEIPVVQEVPKEVKKEEPTEKKQYRREPKDENSVLGRGIKEEPIKIKTLIGEDNNVTVMHFVPSMLNAFLEYIENKRIKSSLNTTQATLVPFELEISGSSKRVYSKTPFIPTDKQEFKSRAELILTMQAEGLAKRVSHTNSKTLVLGISGGLDSALAMLVCVRAFKTWRRCMVPWIPLRL